MTQPHPTLNLQAMLDTCDELFDQMLNNWLDPIKYGELSLEMALVVSDIQHLLESTQVWEA